MSDMEEREERKASKQIRQGDTRPEAMSRTER